MIPAKTKEGKPTYTGMEADFPAMNVGSMQLITHADVDEDLIYNLTKTIWENRKAIAKQHPAGNAINEEKCGSVHGYRISSWSDPILQRNWHLAGSVRFEGDRIESGRVLIGQYHIGSSCHSFHQALLQNSVG